MAKIIYVFLAQQIPLIPARYELYYDGVPSGDVITFDQVRLMLTDNQYKDFMKGETIFPIAHKIDITKLVPVRPKRKTHGIKNTGL